MRHFNRAAIAGSMFMAGMVGAGCSSETAADRTAETTVASDLDNPSGTLVEPAPGEAHESPPYTEGKEIEIPAPQQPFIDALRTPADGENRRDFIVWETARLAVRASTIGNERYEQIIVNYTNREGKDESIGFSMEMTEDCTYEVATVSGWNPEARATLTPEQSALLNQLAEQSLPSQEQQACTFVSVLTISSAVY